MIDVARMSRAIYPESKQGQQETKPAFLQTTILIFGIKSSETV